MASLNKVFLIGNLTQAPGAAIHAQRNRRRRLCGWPSIATTRRRAARNAKRPCFLTIVVWGKQAESCGEYLDKGSPILVEGRLQTRDWEAKDGGKRTVIEVVAERVQFMGRGRAAAPATCRGGPRSRSPKKPAPATTTSRSRAKKRSEPFPDIPEARQAPPVRPAEDL